MPVTQYTGEMRMFLAMALFGAVLIVGVIVGVWRRRVREQSEPEVRKRRAIARLLSDQDNVISGVITEITSQPATYAGFPQEIMTQLMRAHERYPSVSKGRFSEDY